MYSDSVANFLSARFGPAVYVAFAFALLCLPPAGLILAAVRLWTAGRNPAYGAVLGLGVGLWASACYVCIPYLGVYPNLPAAALARALTAVAAPGQHGTAVNEVCVHATNLILWPLVSALAFHGHAPASGRKKPAE